MITLSLESLNKFLQEKKFAPQIQTETNQIYLIFEINQRQFPLFFRILEGEDLLQLLVFMPCDTKEETNPDVARLLHLINKELDIPGFGMDEISGVIFYRVILHANKKKLDPSLLDAFLQSIQMLSETFFPVIAAVAHGAATFEEVLKKAKEDQENQ